MKHAQMKKNPLAENILFRRGFLEPVWNSWTGHEDPESAGADFYIGRVLGCPGLERAIKKGGLNGFFTDMTALYREIYGGQPWGEYLKCSRAECMGKKSLEEVFGEEASMKRLSELESEEAGLRSGHLCPLCAAPMQKYYDEEETRTMLEREFCHEVVAALLYTGEGRLAGFTYGFFISPEMVWREKLEESFLEAGEDREEKMRLCLDASDTDRRKEVFFWNEWAVCSEFRSGIQSLQLVDEVTKSAVYVAETKEEMDMDLIGTALEGSNALSVYRKFKARIIHRSEKTGVVIMRNGLLEARSNISGIMRRIQKHWQSRSKALKAA